MKLNICQCLKNHYILSSITDLTPNTQYALYTTAIVVTNTSKVESTPSETLIAWTDPAFPAFVEVSIRTSFGDKCVLVFH